MEELQCLRNRIDRRLNQIRTLDTQILDARQSGVTGQNLNRWISKLKVKRYNHEQKLELLQAEYEKLTGKKVAA